MVTSSEGSLIPPDPDAKAVDFLKNFLLAIQNLLLVGLDLANLLLDETHFVQELLEGALGFRLRQKG